MKRSAVLIVIVFASSRLTAQSVTGLLGMRPQQAATAQADPLGRNTPSGTVLGFLQAVQDGNDVAAADYLQMSAARRQSQGAELAAKLKVLMDRAFVGHLGRISTSPEGNPENGVIDQQTVGFFSFPDSDVPVVLVRVTDPSAGKIWLFSAETLSKVPELYDNIEAHQVETSCLRSWCEPSSSGCRCGNGWR